MNTFKAIVLGIAVIPLLPVIALMWACVWLTPDSNNDDGPAPKQVSRRPVSTHRMGRRRFNPDWSELTLS